MCWSFSIWLPLPGHIHFLGPALWPGNWSPWSVFPGLSCPVASASGCMRLLRGRRWKEKVPVVFSLLLFSFCLRACITGHSGLMCLEFRGLWWSEMVLEFSSDQIQKAFHCFGYCSGANRLQERLLNRGVWCLDRCFLKDHSESIKEEGLKRGDIKVGESIYN